MNSAMKSATSAITGTLTRTITVLALTAALNGCMSFNPKSLRQMEAALHESNPDVEFESTMKFGIGALTMDFVDFAFVHEAGVDVSKIKRANIGIYEVTHGDQEALVSSIVRENVNRDVADRS